MRVAASSLDLVFQETGVWLWLVHAAMSVVFAGLLYAMWVRLRRPLIGWLAAFFLAHVVAGLAIATYWWGGLVSPVASFVLALIAGGAIIAVAPLSLGAMRELRGNGTLGSRTLATWIVGGMLYGGVAALIILRRPDRPDVIITLLFRPLVLIAACGPVLLFRRTDTVLPINRHAAEAMRVGFIAAAVLQVTETVFRARVAVAMDPAIAITSTVVANLLNLLTLGIAALLAVIAQGRAELQAAFDHEVHLSRQEAQAARLESIGRLAAGIANDFNGVFGDASHHLVSARTQWRQHPDRALTDLQRVRAAVEQGTQITTGLLRLARQQETTPRRMSPTARLQELLPVLSRMMSHAQGLQAELLARGDVYIAPAHFDQIVLNVLLAAVESGQSASVVHITLHDASPEALPEAAPQVVHQAPRAAQVDLPFDTTRSTGWVRLTVTCETAPTAARIAGDDRPVSRPGAWRLDGRDLGAALGHATTQLAAEAAGGHVRVVAMPDSCSAVEVWLPSAGPTASVVTRHVASVSDVPIAGPYVS
jgi:signal transduction histidine kinase